MEGGTQGRTSLKIDFSMYRKNQSVLLDDMIRPDTKYSNHFVCPSFHPSKQKNKITMINGCNQNYSYWDRVVSKERLRAGLNDKDSG